MPDAIVTAGENTIAGPSKNLADALAKKFGVTDPAVIAEYEATFSHAGASVLGTLAPVVENLVGKWLGQAIAPKPAA